MNLEGQIQEKAFIDEFGETLDRYLGYGENVLGFANNVKDNFTTEAKQLQENMYYQTDGNNKVNKLGAIRQSALEQIKEEGINLNTILIAIFGFISLVLLAIGVFK